MYDLNNAIKLMIEFLKYIKYYINQSKFYLKKCVLQIFTHGGYTKRTIENDE